MEDSDDDDGDQGRNRVDFRSSRYVFLIIVFGVLLAIFYGGKYNVGVSQTQEATPQFHPVVAWIVAALPWIVLALFLYFFLFRSMRNAPKAKTE